MALVSMRQVLDHAAENGYGVPAFNVNNLEQIQAIMQAADETRSPVIMQASAGARKYAGEPFLRHLILAAVEIYDALTTSRPYQEKMPPEHAIARMRDLIGSSIEARVYDALAAVVERRRVLVFLDDSDG